jgi:hypothetical protein
LPVRHHIFTVNYCCSKLIAEFEPAELVLPRVHKALV